MDTDIDRLCQGYVDEGTVAGISVVVRQGKRPVFDGSWGYANIEDRLAMRSDTLLRMASMTKVVTAVAALQLVERKALSLDDDVSRFIPSFKRLQVASDYISYEESISLSPATIKERIARARYDRLSSCIRIRDLLTHASGLGTGAIGSGLSERMLKDLKDVKERFDAYARIPLDFAPGTHAAYSPIVGFDLLGRIIEIAAGMPFDEYVQTNIFDPLGTGELTFSPTPEQQRRMSRLYAHKGPRIIDVTATANDILPLDPVATSATCGAAGLVASTRAYARFAEVLLHEGTLDGHTYLDASTIGLMREGTDRLGSYFPGTHWGLGVLVFDDPEAAGRALAPGSFGWSGAFGTHFVVDPANDLVMVIGLNHADPELDGSTSRITVEVERAVMATFRH